MSAVPQAIEATSEPTFDFSARVDALRCHSTDWLRGRVEECRREQQRWWLEELAATRVLDDREALGPMPDPALSARTARTNLKVARELESLPMIAAAAHSGEISRDQLQPLVEVATPQTDREWAHRGSQLSPGDLDRMARRIQEVTAADAEARHAVRVVRTWRDHERGMAGGRWWLPDLDGVLVDKVLDHMAERMRPAKGMKWEPLARRKADALVQLARSYAETEPTGRFRIEIVSIVRPDAPDQGAEIEGIPLAPETVAALMPNAKVRDCVTDANGVARTVGRPRAALPTDIERHVRRRDRTCRVPGCAETRGLQIHHMNAICQHGESWDVRQLVAVCPHHHHLLEPHGPYRLVGDAEALDGLRLVHRDDLARDGPAP